MERMQYLSGCDTGGDVVVKLGANCPHLPKFFLQFFGALGSWVFVYDFPKLHGSV